MKTKDFSNSMAPVLRNPGGNLHVAPPLTQGAEAVRPIGHGGAMPNPPPGSSVRHQEPESTTPAPPPIDTAAELEQMMAALAPAMRAASTPSDLDRLVGVCCATLGSETTMGLLVHELVNPEDVGSQFVNPSPGDALAGRVVRFADEVLRQASSLVERRETPTRP